MKHFAVFFKLAVTAGIFFWLGKQVDWQQLGNDLAGVQFFGYVIALLLLLVSAIMAGIRWYFLLQVQGIYVPLRKVLSLNFIGMFFNVFLLGATGGDVSKLYYLNKYAPNKKTKAIVSLMMDRGIGMLALIAIALPFFPIQATELWGNQDTRLFAQILMILFLSGVGGLLAFFLFPVGLLPQRWRTYLEEHPQLQVIPKLLSSIREHGRSSRITFLAIGISIALQLLNILAGYILARALGFEPTFAQCVIVLAVAFTITSLPISLGGHGVRELVFVKVFYALGVISLAPGAVHGQEIAIAFSLLYYSLQLVWSVVGGLFYITTRHDRPPKEIES